MSNKASFSVIIPTCDRPQLVNRAVNSALAQTIRPLDIIVVNNGSNPLTNDFPPSVKVIEAERYIGPARARNLGAENANGRWLAFLDDDDYWPDDYLERASEMIPYGAPIILSRTKYIHSGEFRPEKQQPFSSAGMLHEDWIKRSLRGNGAGGSNTIIKRNVFRTFCGYSKLHVCGQDNALILDMVIAGWSVVVSKGYAMVDKSPEDERWRHTRGYNWFRGKLYWWWKYANLMSLRDHHYMARSLLIATIETLVPSSAFISLRRSFGSLK